MAYIKLSKKAFFNNLTYFSNICGVDKLAISLKDNAYGHGTFEIASLCSEFGIKHVFVRDIREADIAKGFSFESILVLYDIPDEKHDKFIFSINSLEDIKKLPVGSNVELKIDTGMNRNGITLSEIPKALGMIKEKQMKLKGVFTHFCCADEDNDITKKQEELFLKAVESIKAVYDKPFRIHCANSAGVHKVDMSRYDLARIGIGAFGYLDLDEEKYLQPVMSLHAKRLSTKVLKKGDHVGYGSLAYVSKEEGVKVSNYDIGYGNGFLRLGEQKKAKTACGKEILGRVSMDSFSVVGSQEEITLFENVKELANVHQTITYEILTALSPFLRRDIEQ